MLETVSERSKRQVLTTSGPREMLLAVVLPPLVTSLLVSSRGPPSVPRRQLLQGAAVFVSGGLPGAVHAAVLPEQSQPDSRLFQEERSQRAEAAAAAAAQPRPSAKVSMTPGQTAVTTATPTDEFTIEFSPEAPVGLTLRDLRVGFELGTKDGTSRVIVADVKPGGQAAAGGRVEIDNIVVAVDGVQAT